MKRAAIPDRVPVIMIPLHFFGDPAIEGFIQIEGGDLKKTVSPKNQNQNDGKIRKKVEALQMRILISMTLQSISKASRIGWTRLASWCSQVTGTSEIRILFFLANISSSTSHAKRLT